jgi:hypothetical protein
VQDGVCDGAVFELYLWKILDSLESKPDIAVAPPLPAGSVPDFRLDWPECDHVFVEAAVYWGRAHWQREHVLRSTLLDQVSPHVESAGFCLQVTEISQGQQNPSPKRIARLIDDALSRVDREQMLLDQSRLKGLAFSDAYEFSVVDKKSGWTMRASPVPLANPEHWPNHIAASTGPVGGYMDGRGDLAKKLGEKRRQHKKDNPRLIVAVSCQDWPGDPGDDCVADVLYGTCTADYRKPEQLRYTRLSDGLWSGDAQHSIVGVVTSSMCKAWTVPNDHLTLWLRPGLSVDDVLPGWPFHSVEASAAIGRLSESWSARVSDFLGEAGSVEPGSKQRRLREDDLVF